MFVSSRWNFTLFTDLNGKKIRQAQKKNNTNQQIYIYTNEQHLNEH